MWHALPRLSIKRAINKPFVPSGTIGSAPSPLARPGRDRVPTRTHEPVFINCPFDSQYTPLFEALVFAVSDCGFRARCALEVDDASQVRIEKIYKIIATCKFGIHDISRTAPNPATGLPRFNMPLELGIFLAARWVCY